MENILRQPAKIATSTLLLIKPRIILSVAFTGFAAMVLALQGIPPIDKVFYCLLSLLLSAGGAAILNNILDREVDVLMSRLNKRVEAMQVVGERFAMFIAASFILISLFISFYLINAVNGIFIIAAIISYTLLYTLYLKRSSPYGTILGGIPGALPVLIGFSAINPGLGLSSLILFFFMILWQPPHFWALAQKYKEDYRTAGVPVMPVVLGTKYTNILMLIYAISLLPLSLSLWYFGYNSSYYAISAVALGVYFDYVVIKCAITNTGYGKAFGVSILYMLGIMLSLVLDIAVRSA